MSVILLICFCRLSTSFVLYVVARPLQSIHQYIRQTNENASHSQSPEPQPTLHSLSIADTMSKQFSANDVKDHSTVDKGLYIIIDSNVYEMGGFVDEHPGGAKILKRVGGKDASKQFWKVGHTL